MLLIVPLVLLFGFLQTAKAQEFDRTHYIYDRAQLLTEAEAAELQTLAAELGGQRETAFIIITLNGSDGKDIVQYVEDFYDENAPGFDQPHGNTAILAIDMGERDIYLAGFKKAEQYLNDERLDQIRDQITPDLSDGQYFQAFSQFLNTSYEYMGQEPTSDSSGSKDYGYGGGSDGQNHYVTGTDEENIFFQWWFQLISSLVVAGIVVTIMAYRSGGRVTVNAQTYMDHDKSRVIGKHDTFTHQTVTRQRKPSNNTSSGGGGITGGGHSHSGSRGKF
nr:TPM domain-containing protein [Neobacillus citreus]